MARKVAPLFQSVCFQDLATSCHTLVWNQHYCLHHPCWSEMGYYVIVLKAIRLSNDCMEEGAGKKCQNSAWNPFDPLPPWIRVHRLRTLLNQLHCWDPIRMPIANGCYVISLNRKGKSMQMYTVLGSPYTFKYSFHVWQVRIFVLI